MSFPLFFYFDLMLLTHSIKRTLLITFETIAANVEILKNSVLKVNEILEIENKEYIGEVHDSK